MPTITPTDMGVREKQAVAVEALAVLLRHGELPTLMWEVPMFTPGYLDGFAPTRDDQHQVDAVIAWANFLGVDVTEADHDHDGFTWKTYTAITDYMGARVKVWAVVDRKKKAA